MCRQNSSGGAPDGEEYFATALIFAHNRWGDDGKYDYAKEAQWVLGLIRTKYFDSKYHLVKFVAGSNNTDASYILPRSTKCGPASTPPTPRSGPKR